MPKRIKTGKIKSNQTYRVNELAEVANVTPTTVRHWLKTGLSRIDGKRPTLILGFQALAFLSARKAKARCPLGVDEFFCFRCKARRKALGSMADYEPISANSGRLKALCAICECQCNRNISASDLADVCKALDVANRGNRCP